APSPAPSPSPSPAPAPAASHESPPLASAPPPQPAATSRRRLADHYPPDIDKPAEPAAADDSAAPDAPPAVRFLTYDWYGTCGGIGDYLIGLVSIFPAALLDRRALLVAQPCMHAAFRSPHIDTALSPDVPMGGHPLLRATPLDALSSADAIASASAGDSDGEGEGGENGPRVEWHAPPCERLEGNLSADVADSSAVPCFNMVGQTFAIGDLQRHSRLSNYRMRYNHGLLISTLLLDDGPWAAALRRLGFKIAYGFGCILRFLFSPRPEVWQLVAGMEEHVWGEGVVRVAVHLRVPDQTVWHFEGAPLDTSQQQLEELLAEANSTLQCAQTVEDFWYPPPLQVKWILITNSHPLKQVLKAKYPHKVVATDFIPWHSDRATEHENTDLTSPEEREAALRGLQHFRETVAEWALVASCHTFIIPASGFSRTAALYALRPLDMHAGMWVSGHVGIVRMPIVALWPAMGCWAASGTSQQVLAAHTRAMDASIRLPPLANILRLIDRTYSPPCIDLHGLSADSLSARVASFPVALITGREPLESAVPKVQKLAEVCRGLAEAEASGAGGSGGAERKLQVVVLVQSDVEEKEVQQSLLKLAAKERLPNGPTGPAIPSQPPWIAVPCVPSDVESLEGVLTEAAQTLSVALDIVTSSADGLALFDSTGRPLLRRGAEVLEAYGSDAWPFTPARIAELEAAKADRDAKEQQLGALLATNDRDWLLRGGGGVGGGGGESGEPLDAELAKERIADSLAGKRVVGLYFGAAWCPPCEPLLQRLTSAYHGISEKHGKHALEVVYVSCDTNEREFLESVKGVPWLAVPFADKATRDALVERFSSKAIPSIVFLDNSAAATAAEAAAEGAWNEAMLRHPTPTITRDGRDVIMEVGAEGFPFSAEHVERARAAK
ncbi:unnamed protein product, partial [Closterium sp. NIES-65]